MWPTSLYLAKQPLSRIFLQNVPTIPAERRAGKDNGRKGSAGDRPSGPNRSNNRERNQGIDEEHSRTPKGNDPGPRRQ